MPTLPNLGDIPQAQFDRIVAAFPGDTPAKKVVAYRAWLTNRLIERVQQSEMARIDAETAAAKSVALTEMYASLPPPADEPPLR